MSYPVHTIFLNIFARGRPRLNCNRHTLLRFLSVCGSDIQNETGGSEEVEECPCRGVSLLWLYIKRVAHGVL